MRTIATAILAGVVLVTALAGSLSAAGHPAAFHAALKKSWPAANDTIPAGPDSLKLWFSEKVETSMVFVKLTGSAKNVTLGAFAYASKAADAPVTAAVNAKLLPGTYTVSWKVGAKDGHPSNGTFAFTVRGK